MHGSLEARTPQIRCTARPVCKGCIRYFLLATTVKPGGSSAWRRGWAPEACWRSGAGRSSPSRTLRVLALGCASWSSPPPPLQLRWRGETRAVRGGVPMRYKPRWLGCAVRPQNLRSSGGRGQPAPRSSFAGAGRPEPSARAFQCGKSCSGQDVLSAPDVPSRRGRGSRATRESAATATPCWGYPFSSRFRVAQPRR